MKMRISLSACRESLLVTLVVKLMWIQVGLSMHMDGARVLTQEQWERKVRSASNLDELLRLIDFPDWKLWKCRLKLQQLDTQPEFRSSSSFPSSSSSSSSSAGSHRSTRYAAVSYSLEILKAIDEEWQRTQCMPRETCVDIAKELGTDPSMFFKPPCVSVYRCNGCCNTEAATCRNTTTTYVNKTLLSVIPFKFGPEPILIKVANHTECKCMEPAIIRRNARIHKKRGCSPMRQLSETQDTRQVCESGLLWDCAANRCIPYPSTAPEFLLSSWMPDCEIDVERCDCLPRLQTTPQPRPVSRCLLNSTDCAKKGQRFEEDSCSCK